MLYKENSYLWGMKSEVWHIERYSSQRKVVWDDFVKRSKNATFLFFRDYMDYHADRFQDASLLIYRGGSLVALLPGNLSDTIFYSHQGLTYGGLLLLPTVTFVVAEQALREALCYLKQQLSVCQVMYRAIPHIYHQQPAEEDLYALYRLGATLHSRALSSVLQPSNENVFRLLRRRQQKRAERMNFSIVEDEEYVSFWPVLTSNLQSRHGVSPVHTLEEIKRLHSCFPHQIRLFRVLSDAGETMGGCVVYDCACVAHVQYIAATEIGKKEGALDLLFAHLIDTCFQHKIYFDFGISTENEGRLLNEGLLFQKEGFGARAVLYDTYVLDLAVCKL